MLERETIKQSRSAELERDCFSNHSELYPKDQCAHSTGSSSSSSALKCQTDKPLYVYHNTSECNTIFTLIMVNLNTFIQQVCLLLNNLLLEYASMLIFLSSIWLKTKLFSYTIISRHCLDLMYGSVELQVPHSFIKLSLSDECSSWETNNHYFHYQAIYQLF